MIRITCTNCKAQLSIDDAFAGGACRCQFCGTIQTVPKHLKDGASTQGMHAKAAATGGTSQTLFRNKSKSNNDTGLSSGLDAIAEVVASSGLSGSGLSSSNPRRSKLVAAESDAAAPVKNKMLPILLIAGIVIILLLGVVIGLLVKGSGGGAAKPEETATSPDNATPNVTAPPPTPVTNAPAFFGVKLNEPTVIFVLDRGSGTHASFDYMKIACLNAIDSLRPDQNFQVIFWKLDRDRDPVMLPKSPVSASDKAEIKKLEKALDDVSSFGQSDVKSAMEKALGQKPGAIVIATGKPLDESFVKTVLDARKSNTVKVDCLALGDDASSIKAMQDVAKKTGGTFRAVPLGELQSVSR